MPYNDHRILKFNPEDNSVQSGGEDFGDQDSKFRGTNTLKANMQKYPEELGRLFVKNRHGKTFYEVLN
jgi:hypothetical protein